ncbi:MAG: hypothetical protein ACPHN2_11150 [Sinimarinibacterium flocculans]|uniref:hypothetical protein n=1 Tax=Sinimarinibacterium flocculans TaxID=985250 RepID=UPI003C585A57
MTPLLNNAPVLIAMFGGAFVSLGFGASVLVLKVLPRFGESSTRKAAELGGMCAGFGAWFPAILVGGFVGKAQGAVIFGSLSVPYAMVLSELVLIPAAMIGGAFLGAALSVLWNGGENT